MDDFCQKVLEKSFDGVKEICESNRDNFNIDYVVPDSGGETAIRGYTALGIAIRKGHNEIAQYLIEQCQAAVNAPDSSASTPLFHAVNSFNQAGVDILLKYNATIDQAVLERLGNILGHEVRFSYPDKIIAICQRLIDTLGRDIPAVLNTCISSLTTELTTSYFTPEDSVNAEWSKFEDDVTNLTPVDNQMTGTVNFNNLIDTMASVAPWVGVVSALIGITGLGCYCLKKMGSGSNENRSEVKHEVELIKRNTMGLFIDEPKDHHLVVHSSRLLSGSSKELFR